MPKNLRLKNDFDKLTNKQTKIEKERIIKTFISKYIYITYSLFSNIVKDKSFLSLFKDTFVIGAQPRSVLEIFVTFDKSLKNRFHFEKLSSVQLGLV